ncbi:MAG: hypothetical protein AAF721_09110 [Myxococcota bacterium]
MGWYGMRVGVVSSLLSAIAACDAEEPPEPAAVECADFHEEDDGPEVLLRLTNTSDTPAFVSAPDSGSWYKPLPLRLADVSGEDVPIRTAHVDLGFHSCESVQKRGPGGGGDYSSFVVRMEPGAVYEQPWFGEYFSRRKMPAECTPSPDPDPIGCLQRRIVDPGSYTLSVTATTECDDCDCTPDASGCCSVGVFDRPIPWGEFNMTAAVSFDYPADTTIELEL